jgi:serine/alanine racemase
MKSNLGAKQNLDSFDVARVLCALLIIVIHTEPLAPYSAIANFYLCNVVARIAVPLFFAMSGFLFSRKANLKRQIFRIGKIYLCWSFVYLLIQIPQWYRTGWWGIYVVKDYIVAFVTQGSYYHLWYLLTTIYALPMLYVLIRKASKHVVVGIVSVLWVIECLVYSYTWIGIEDRFPQLIALINRFSAIFDALFRALPLMVIGVVAGENHVRRTAKEWGKRALAALCFSITEASLLYFFSPNENRFSYLFTTPLVTYYLICFLLTWKIEIKNKWVATIFRNGSLTMYCLHPFVHYFVRKTQCPEGVLQWILVTVLSASIALLVEWICGTYDSRKWR